MITIIKYKKVNNLEKKYLNRLLESYDYREYELKESLSYLVDFIRKKLDFFRKNDKLKFIPRNLLPLVFLSLHKEEEEPEDMLEKVKGFSSKIFPDMSPKDLNFGDVSSLNLDVKLSKFKALDNVFSKIGVSLDDDSTKYYILVNSILLSIPIKEIEKLEIRDLNDVNLREFAQAIALGIARILPAIARSLPLAIRSIGPILTSLVRSGALNRSLIMLARKFGKSLGSIKIPKPFTKIHSILKNNPVVVKIFMDYLARNFAENEGNLENLENDFLLYIKKNYPINFSIFNKLPNSLTSLNLTTLEKVDRKVYELFGVKNLLDNDLVKLYLMKKALIKRIPLPILEREYSDIIFKVLEVYERAFENVKKLDTDQEE